MQGPPIAAICTDEVVEESRSVVHPDFAARKCVAPLLREVNFLGEVAECLVDPERRHFETGEIPDEALLTKVDTEGRKACEPVGGIEVGRMGPPDLFEIGDVESSPDQVFEWSEIENPVRPRVGSDRVVLRNAGNENVRLQLSAPPTHRARVGDDDCDPAFLHARYGDTVEHIPRENRSAWVNFVAARKVQLVSCLKRLKAQLPPRLRRSPSSPSEAVNTSNCESTVALQLGRHRLSTDSALS